MILLKFRNANNILGDFTHYAEVEDEKIKRYVGPIAHIHQVSFRISAPIHEDLQPYFNNMTEDIWVLRIPYDFYFVDGNYFVIYTLGHQFIPIHDMRYYLWCYFDYQGQNFLPIGGLNMQFAVTTRDEIEQNNLERIEL